MHTTMTVYICYRYRSPVAYRAEVLSVSFFLLHSNLRAHLFACVASFELYKPFHFAIFSVHKRKDLL